MQTCTQCFDLRLVKDGRLPVSRPVIRTPEDAVDLLRAEFENLPFERFVCIPLSTKNHAIGLIRVSSGTLNSSLVHGRDLFVRLLLSGGCSAIISHNHPSGLYENCGLAATPSPEDLELTKRLLEVSKILDFPILDHIIIAGPQYYSMKEHGHL